MLFLFIILAMLIGIACGIITGLTPGVHINLVSAILLSLAPLLALYVPLLAVCCLIMAMAITHHFLDSIPSVFLGAPDDSTAMGVLPGHRYLLRGNGLMAVKLFAIGGVLGAIFSIVLFIPIFFIIKYLSAFAKPYLFWIILAIVIFMIWKDKKPAWAIIIFCISGILGFITLRLTLSEPLLPLLSGIFGTATLLYSINENQNIPLQKNECYTELEPKKTILGTILGLAGGFITALLPGISAASASALTTRGTDIGDHGFMVLLGSLGTASFIFSLASFLAIEKSRNGAMSVIVALSEINTSSAIVLLCVALIAAGAAFLLALWMGRNAASWLPRIPYRKTCICVILFVVLIVYLRAGSLGLLVLLTSTAVGLLPASLKTARAQAMGCLLLPLLFFLY